DIHISRPFHLGGVVAELVACQTGSGLGVHAGIFEFLDALRNVETQLALQVAVQTPWAESVIQAPEPLTHSAEPFQRPTPSGPNFALLRRVVCGRAALGNRSAPLDFSRSCPIRRVPSRPAPCDAAPGTAIPLRRAAVDRKQRECGQ